MSGYKSHGSKHSRDRDRDRDREADGDSSRHHHHRDRGESRGREGSRDARDRDHRSKHSDSKEARGAPGSSQGTPTKPPGGPAVAGGGAAPRAAAGAKLPATGGGLLGSSFLSSTVLEAAKRKAAEAAAAADRAGAAAEEAEDGEVGGGPRKKPKHEPIVWHSPPRQGGSQADRPASQQETLQERLQREAAEFRQQQQQHDAARPSSRQQRPGSRTGRSPSSSDSSRSRSRGRAGGSPEDSRRKHRRRRSSSSERSHSHSSRSRSPSGSRGRSRDSREGGKKKAGGRWQQEEEEEDQQQQQQKAKQPGKSRWNVEEEEEGAAREEVEEGEAVGDGVGTAIDEELEELNRQERAALAAGGVSDGEASPGPDGGSDEAELLRHEGLDLHHNMLDESRKVEEYEKLNRISEGTYGIVFRARCKSTGKIYALKKLKMEHCPDGFPQTSVREVNVLLSLHHPNIVNVAEVCVGGRDGIFMVMEYVEHDLKYVMELQKAKKAQQFSIGQIKCLMQQLLEGVAFLHHRWVIHRDLKTSNLLYSNTGQLKICDFGLARQYGYPLSPYTPMVVTLWYRAIERLLGDPSYEGALDMWSVGCIMGELLLGEPLFQGKGEMDQIKKIFALLGTPTQESWPGWDELPDCKHLQFKPEESRLRSKFPTVFFGGSAPILSDAGFDLLSRLLEMNPAKRITAEEALKHRWFQEAPRPVTPALMPSFTPRHQQSSAADYRDKLQRPSPGAVGPAGFKI